jgi:hypothetical protein
MSVQQYFDSSAFRFLPRLSAVIEGAAPLDGNQMRCKALRMMGCLPKSLAEMNGNELCAFQDAMISIFEFKGWM